VPTIDQQLVLGFVDEPVTERRWVRGLPDVTAVVRFPWCYRVAPVPALRHECIH
jgi:hypothetical protein